MPRSPLPGTTSRPSSVRTLVFGPSLNVAVESAASAVVVDAAMPIASRRAEAVDHDQPVVVAQQPGLGLRRPDHPAGDDHPQRGDVPAVGLGVERLEDRLGERVTDDRQAVHPARARTVSSSSTASKCRPTVVTIEPASASVHIALNAPVPCINGAAGRFDGPGLDTRAVERVPARRRRERPLRRGVEAGEHVVLTPHHALGHARRPAGVEQVQVVGRASPRCGHPLGCRRRRRRIRQRPSRGTVPTPSSTQIQHFTVGTRSRIAAHRSVNVPWKITASASALFHR